MEFCTDLITEPEEIKESLNFFSDKLRRLKNQLEKERIDYEDFLEECQEAKVLIATFKDQVDQYEVRLKGIDRGDKKHKRSFKTLDRYQIDLSKIISTVHKFKNQNRLLLEFSLDKLENEVAATEKIVAALQKKLPPKE